jgi:hypothetical protein
MRTGAARRLKSYGCDFGQGYHIARPLSSEDAARFMGYEPNPRASVHIGVNDDFTGSVGWLSESRRLYRKK